MYIDDKIMKKIVYSNNEDTLDLTEKERDGDIDSKDLENTSIILQNEELRKQIIGKAVKKVFLLQKEKEELKKEKEINPINLFISEYITKKRGRKTLDSTNSSKKKTHTATDWDNNLRKIQNHFLNFVISYLNNIIYSYLTKKDLYFLKFSYSDKKNVKFEYVEKLKNYNIKQLLENLGMSTKYKATQLKKNENINEKILNDLCKYDWFDKVIQTKFLKLFKVYYNQKCPLKEISLNGKKIPFEDTECFYNLLKKNKGNEKKLIETAEAVYLNN